MLSFLASIYATINKVSLARSLPHSRQWPKKNINGLFQKKSKQGEQGVEDILFWKALPEILDLWLYPKKFQRKKAFTPGNSANLCDTPLEIPKWKTKTHGNSALVFLEHPWSLLLFFFRPLEFLRFFFKTLEVPCPQLPPIVWIFSGIAQCLMVW